MAAPETKSPTEKLDEAAEHDAAVDNSEQPFLDHIIELRARIIRVLIIVGLLSSRCLSSPRPSMGSYRHRCSPTCRKAPA